MNELVYLKNNEAVCSSLQVAEKFEKRHANVMRAIDSLVKNDSTQNCVQCFKETTYKDSTGKSNKMYVMNRDGFTFLVMGFTGKKANEWKWQYIKAFNQMEKFIREKETQAWIDSRRVYARSGKELSEFLTFYYVPELDAIVLNKNHKNYGHFKELLPIYLQFNNLQKKEFLPMPRGMGMTFFDSVNKVLRVRKKIKNRNKYKP